MRSGSASRRVSIQAGRAGLEEVCVQRVDDVVERVVGRQTAFVGQEAAQEVQALLAPRPDLHEVVHAAQRGAQHQQQGLGQRIHDPPMLAWVLQRREVIHKRR